MVTTFAVFHFDRSALNVAAPLNKLDISVTSEVSQFSIAPYFSVAATWLMNQASTMSWMVGHLTSELFWKVTSPLLGHLLQDPPPSVTTKGSLCGSDMYEPALQQPYRPLVPEDEEKASDHCPPHIVRVKPLLEKTGRRRGFERSGKKNWRKKV